jgi:IS1 family transposase
MNKLNRDKQLAAIRCLVDGNSIRATERIVGAHRDTIMRLMVRVGDGCERLLDEKMVGLGCQRLQVDELWCYIKKKARHITADDDPTRTGDVWTFVAIDADTKLVPCYRIGQRDHKTATAFLGDLSSRLTGRVQLSSDALRAYVDAVERSFGSNVDFAQIAKSYEAEPIGPGRYSPPKVVATRVTHISGNPDPAHISTSFIERQNLTVRMSMRRFTRLTNAFSKKLENLKAAVALHFAYYNFVRVHRSLRVTPAMAAGVVSNLWTMDDLFNAVE